MKHNWEYKKLEEVGRINYGTRIVQKNAKGSTYYVYGGGGATFMTDEYNREDCFIVSRFAMSPKCTRYVQGKFFLNDSGLSVESSLDGLKQAFLDKALQANNDKIYSLGKGAAQRNLDINAFKKLIIPLPPLPIQQKIVAELDKVCLIIDKKKQQLKELDNLAQAIFYDMFGDPVENEKGWEVKRLEDNCEVSSSKRVLVEDVVEEGIPFLRGTELSALNKASSSKEVQFTMFITTEHYEKLKSITGVPKKGDILIPSINSEGISWVVDTDEPFYFKDGRVIWVHMNTNVFSSQYLKYAISQILKINYAILTSGATFLELKLFIVRDLLIPLPPLSLQQSFAAKIEAIEKQKELISRSIKEAQTLFDERMDYWFN